VTTVQTQYNARELVAALPIAALVLDGELRVDHSNALCRELWGLEEAWLGTRPSYRSLLEKLRDTRRLPEQVDFRTYLDQDVARLNGLIDPIQDTLFLPSGKVLNRSIAPFPGGILVTFIDMSETLSATRTLKETQSVHQSLLDQLDEGLALFGADGRLRYQNSAFQKIWDLESDFLESQPSLSQFLDATRKQLPIEPDWPAVRDKLAGGLLGRSPRRSRIILNDGRALDAANLPLPDGGAVLTYRDSTTEHAAETELRERAQTAQNESRLKSHFMAMLSHELRTPLTTLIGFAELLDSPSFGDLNAKQADYAAGIERTAHRMLVLLTDVLDLSSLESGHETLSVESFALAPFLATLFARFESLALDKKVVLTLDCAADIGWLSADENRLDRALGHLMANALEFTGPGGTVSLKAVKKDNTCVFTVADTGVGLPQDEMERLNLPGALSLSEEELFSGHGLGLNIVKELIAHHGGSFSLTSRPNRGTTITCELPSA